MKHILIGAALAMAAAPAGAAEAPALLPLDALAEIPFISNPLLSPDGKRLLAKVNSGGKEALAIYDLAAGSSAPPKILPHPDGVRWYRWAGNGRVLVSSMHISIFMAVLPVPVTRVVSHDLATDKVQPVSTGGGLMGDDVIFVDPDGRFVLLSQQKDIFDSPSVHRVDLDTGKSVEIQKKKADIWSWFADGAGTIRGGISYDGNRWSVYAADPRTGALRKTSSGKMSQDRESAVESIYLLPGSDTGVIVTNERTGRFGVYKYDLNGLTIGDPIFEHAEVDVTTPKISQDGAVEGVYFDDDKPRVKWLDPDLERVQRQLDRTFAGKVNRIEMLSRDRNTALVWSGGADDPGAYYVFDRQAKRMNLFAAPYLKLIDQPLSEVKPVRYRARDGLSIPGYLTVPRGREAKGLPLIVMPHGGPFVRDRYEFDPMVQFLASRGYAVLQPNFRGSTGYGRDFVEKGYGEMGLKMQDDLDDGVAWLAGDGTIDPKRVCILGSSYGGYAALWGAIRNPDIYRCAVSFAGVTDVAGILKYDSKFLLARRYFKQHRKKIEGEQKRDLAAVSPLQQAGRLKVPVLVAHGEQDSTVPADQSRKLVTALKGRGAAVQSAFYPEAAHGFSSSADSLDFMKRVEAFLELHNPATPGRAKGPREAQRVAGSIEGAQLLSQSRKKPSRNAVDLRYRVTADGRVTSCTVEKSSGLDAIDKHACALAEQQFQYRPALSSGGEREESWATYAVSLQPPAKK